MKTYIYFSLLSSVMFCNSAYAACTPSPDCASLGYTASSCPNGGLKCPFDTSKWHCNECGEAYQFDCKGSNEMGGYGNPCNGKYAYCNCSSGYTWSGGVCKKTAAPSGYCCNDGSTSCSYSSSAYNYCKSNYGYVDCSAMQSSCRSFGGTPRLLGCSTKYDYGSYGYSAEFECNY